VNGHLLVLDALAVFLAMIAPGPDMMFVLATGARGGPRIGLRAAFGGCCPWRAGQLAKATHVLQERETAA
jgi:threonine/homoserine/homoserine lactone efflux protein